MNNKTAATQRYEKYARRAILSLEEYTPGTHANRTDVIKISANENDFGTSPTVYQALRRCLDEEARLNRYPDSTCAELRQALAARSGLPPECFLVGNGLDDVLNMLGTAFLESGDEVVLPTMCFVVYADISKTMNAQVVAVPMRPDFGIDLDATFAAVTTRTKMVFLCSPNNPTGRIIAKREFEAFMRRIGRLDTPPLVVVDQAYVDYQERNDDHFDAAAYLEEFPFMLALRTFSKISGLAGLRVGYAAASHDLLSYLYRIRPPYTVNSLAQAAALADVVEPAAAVFRNETAEAVCCNRRELEDFLAAENIAYVPSCANFVFAFYDRGREELARIAAALAQKGILVRTLLHENAPDGLRFSIGTAAENRALIAALGEIIAH